MPGKRADHSFCASKTPTKSGPNRNSPATSLKVCSGSGSTGMRTPSSKASGWINTEQRFKPCSTKASPIAATPVKRSWSRCARPRKPPIRLRDTTTDIATSHRNRNPRSRPKDGRRSSASRSMTTLRFSGRIWCADRCVGAAPTSGATWWSPDGHLLIRSEIRLQLGGGGG